MTDPFANLSDYDPANKDIEPLPFHVARILEHIDAISRVRLDCLQGFQPNHRPDIITLLDRLSDIDFSLVQAKGHLLRMQQLLEAKFTDDQVRLQSLISKLLENHTIEELRDQIGLSCKVLQSWADKKTSAHPDHAGRLADAIEGAFVEDQE